MKLKEEIELFRESVFAHWAGTTIGVLAWIMVYNVIAFLNYRKNHHQTTPTEPPKLELVEEPKGPEADSQVDVEDIESEIDEVIPPAYKKPKNKPRIVRVYSRVKPEDYITKNFQLQEFLSPDGTWPTLNEFKSILYLADQVQVVRTYLGCPIFISSGHRPEHYNIKIDNAASKSYHIVAMAADGQSCIPPKELAQVFKDLMDAGLIELGGLGIYNTHVHYDTRGVYILFKGNLAA